MKLKRNMSIVQGVALAIGLVVGSGILGLPGESLRAGIAAAAIGWPLICLIALPLIAVFVRLGRDNPSADGLAGYAKKALGEYGPYLLTALVLGSMIFGMPALAFIGGAYVSNAFGSSEMIAPLFAIALVLLCVALNWRGIKIAFVINIISVAALILLVLTLVLSNTHYLLPGLQQFQTAMAGSNFDISVLWQVCALLFWAFMGWENVSFALEELRDPQRNIARVYWWGYFIVVALYLALALVCVGAAASGQNVYGAAGLSALLPVGIVRLIMLAAMAIIIIANCNAWIYSASRMVFSAARSGVLPGSLSVLSKNGVPRRALLALGCVFTLVILISAATGAEVKTLIMIVNQNFLIIYLVCLLAYWQIFQSVWARIIGILALSSCVFLMSGFSWWIIYPLFLAGAAYFAYRRHASKSRSKN